MRPHRYYLRHILLLLSLFVPALAFAQSGITIPPSAGTGPAPVGASQGDGTDSDSPFSPVNNLNDAVFALTVAQHHQIGIALLDIVIARSSNQQVTSLAQDIRDDNAQELQRLQQISSSQGFFQSGSASDELFDDMLNLFATDPANLAAIVNLLQAPDDQVDNQFLVAFLAHHSGAIGLAYRALPFLTTAELQQLAREIARETAEEVGQLEELRRGVSSGDNDDGDDDGDGDGSTPPTTPGTPDTPGTPTTPDTPGTPTTPGPGDDNDDGPGSGPGVDDDIDDNGDDNADDGPGGDDNGNDDVDDSPGGDDDDADDDNNDS